MSVRALVSGKIDSHAYFGPSIDEHARDFRASARSLATPAGWRGDTIVLVNLYDARVSMFTVAPTAAAPGLRISPARAMQLPLAFDPLPVWTANDSSRNVVAQYQLRDALVVPGIGIAVLRYVTYTWESARLWERTPGSFTPSMAIEVYDFDGKRLRGAKLDGTSWRGLAVDGKSIWVYGPGDGRDPNLPVLIRYSQRMVAEE
jgi:hypothetical protein